MICTYKEKLNEVQKTPSRIQSNPSVNISMEKYSSTVKYLSGKPSLRPNGVVVVELLEIAMINVVHYARNSAMLEWHFFFPIQLDFSSRRNLLRWGNVAANGYSLTGGNLPRWEYVQYVAYYSPPIPTSYHHMGPMRLYQS